MSEPQILGKLYLIPTTLGETSALEVIPLSVKKVIEMVDHYIVENEKTARRSIKAISPGKSQPKLQIKQGFQELQIQEPML